jgi:hypothetical protein
MKVDPPSWWANHTINPVRLLVRGANLRGAKVTPLNPELRASEVSVNDRGTYLFVDVQISPSLPAGRYPLLIESPSGSTMIPFSVESPLDRRTHFQGITTDDVIYLIMIDRFARKTLHRKPTIATTREVFMAATCAASSINFLISKTSASPRSG